MPYLLKAWDGGEIHDIVITDEMDLVPLDHDDIDLEIASLSMGAKPLACVEALVAWDKHPFLGLLTLTDKVPPGRYSNMVLLVLVALELEVQRLEEAYGIESDTSSLAEAKELLRETKELLFRAQLSYGDFKVSQRRDVAAWCDRKAFDLRNSYAQFSWDDEPSFARVMLNATYLILLGAKTYFMSGSRTSLKAWMLDAMFDIHRMHTEDPAWLSHDGARAQPTKEDVASSLPIFVEAYEEAFSI